MPGTSKQMKMILVVLILLGAVTIVGYHFLRASDIQMASARRAFDAGRYDVAEEALIRATGYDPDNARAWYRLGITRKCMGKIPGAAEALARAVELNDSNVNWWFECAQLQQWARRFDAAERAWKRTLDLLPPDDGRRREAQVNLARVIVFQGDVDRGLEVLREMVASSDDPELRFDLAQLLSWVGRLEESAKQYQIGLQQKSENQP